MNELTRSAAPRRPHVVILGAGFGGLTAAKTLRRAPVDVTIIDRTNHHLFQPLLYQAATGVLSPADIASPIRIILNRQRNVDVTLATVDEIDAGRRVVIVDEGKGEVPYDYLIVATGARHSYFGNPQWEQHAPGLKSLSDALNIRGRFFSAIEKAEKTADPEARAALLTFVVVGAGPTGVELAGILPTITRNTVRHHFRRVDPANVRVILLEGGPRVLPAFDERLSARASRDLESLGVEVRTNSIVSNLDEHAVYLGDERIPTRTVFWGAGNEASPVVASLGAALDRAGRVLVDPDLSVPGRPEVFVIGDAAAARLFSDDAEARSWDRAARQNGSPIDPQEPPRFVPGVAPAANQMGRHAAKMIVRMLRNERRTAFRYRDKGNLAVIGRSRAVVSVGRARITGWTAWIFWLFIHLMYLVGFRNRLVVLFSWAYSFLANKPNAALISEPLDRARNAPGLMP
jgi:NADH:ubiquinone reductase (H+-translocating)